MTAATRYKSPWYLAEDRREHRFPLDTHSKTTLRNALLASLGAAAALSQSPPEYTDSPSTLRDFPYLNNTSIWEPAENEQLIYPRYVELLDGTILVTVSRRVLEGETRPEDAYFPVYASMDGGASWDWISNITDQVNGRGMGAQPALLESTEPIGDYAEGTILASGNSWSESGTRTDVYARHDKAQTLYEHELICFYSDRRDPQHGQKLDHEVTRDLKHWDPPINDVAYPTYADRPGMTVIAHLPDDTWIFVHEDPGGSSLGLAKYPVFSRIVKSPLDFFTDDPMGRPIVAEGFQPSSSPYVVWSPLGGPNGTTVVSDADHSGVFLNTTPATRAAGATI